MTRQTTTTKSAAADTSGVGVTPGVGGSTWVSSSAYNGWVWTSDMTDALARQSIQRWTAQLVAPECLGRPHLLAPIPPDRTHDLAGLSGRYRLVSRCRDNREPRLRYTSHPTATYRAPVTPNPGNRSIPRSILK
jgi:hypothetical protein